MISTTKLCKLLGYEGELRLSREDRSFLKDLSKVRIIDLKDANQFHYSARKNGGRNRLDKFANMGILVARDIHKPGCKSFRTYEFSNHKIAKAFGGKTAVIGRKRSALHETLASKTYFATGRPSTFKVSSDFNREDLQQFRDKTSLNATLPDAMFFNEKGEMVIVEADSGQYTKQQVLDKQIGWQGIKQVWSQPLKASAKITGAAVFRFG